jgi:uncharacterized protein
MHEFPANNVTLTNGFWLEKQQLNAQKAIFHQWNMLEASGCIDNFRIAAGEKEGLREGWFFADSDATKWLDAASRIERNQHDPDLYKIMDEFIHILSKAQCQDGYLFTYNQIHFPSQRWVNLQIEHELYCHGHLIEAGVSHFEATKRKDLLTIAQKAADLLVCEFLNAGPEYTPGHEEVEIALIRLWKVTGETSYLNLAKHFLDNRGKTPNFGFKLIKQLSDHTARENLVKQAHDEYCENHVGTLINRVPAENKAVKPQWITLRYVNSAFSGKYFQQHRPIKQQTVPVGHSVRFGYMETAQAMLAREIPDTLAVQNMETAWERMITRRMDVSGGLGALPILEGFGRDYELNPEVAYNETCAALSSLFWSWQMELLTGKPRYSDLFEWQLFNAVSVGMGATGENYLYNNPTCIRGGITRQPWYSIPCCPSNLSRTYADLGRYIFTYDDSAIWIHQYMSCKTSEEISGGIRLEIQSDLPWNGKVHIQVFTVQAIEKNIQLRIPSWVGEARIQVNREDHPILPIPTGPSETLCGLDPRKASFFKIQREWQNGDQIDIEFDLPIQILHPHKRVKNLQGHVVVTRGPLVYCLESVDNPEEDLFSCSLIEESLKFRQEKTLFGEIICIYGRDQSGKELTFLPYFLWGNRGTSQMNVWIKSQN